jgi:hypothetical protein
MVGAVSYRRRIGTKVLIEGKKGVVRMTVASIGGPHVNSLTFMIVMPF